MGNVYFGTEDLMQWIVAPAINIDRSKHGWFAKKQFLNGGASIRRSGAGHIEYAMDWSLKSGETIDPIHAYAEGAYGDGLIHFLDPFATKHNILPQALASPYLAANDGPILSGWDETRPTLSATPTNTGRYPVNAAVYTLVGTETPLEVWIPIPVGFTFHMGAHGSATDTAVVTVTPDGAGTTNLTLLAANTLTRTNYTSVGATGVTISTDGAGILTLYGMIAQILPTGESVLQGYWLTGQGNSGCSFDDYPTDTGYNAELDFRGVSAKLTEVGLWQLL